MTPPGCCQSNISLRKITERFHCISLCGSCLEFLFFWTNSQYQAEAQRPSKLDCFGQVAEISSHWLPCPMSCLSGQIRLQCCALRAVIKNGLLGSGLLMVLRSPNYRVRWLSTTIYWRQNGRLQKFSCAIHFALNDHPSRFNITKLDQEQVTKDKI